MDEDIIHIDRDISFIDELSKEVVHHRLEGGGGVHEAKEHDHRFEEATVRFEHSLPLVAIAHADVVIPPMDIQLRKERQPAAVHPRESVHELSNEREWGSVVTARRAVRTAMVF